MDHAFDITPTAGPAYPVRFGADVGAGLEAVWSDGWHRAAVVGDDTTIELFGAALEEPLAQRGVEVIRVSFPPGEAHKTRETKVAIEDVLLEAGLERGSAIVGVGGGVPLDVAGFVAATYMRGIAHLLVATTLLAQVDAALGGKTGVNTPFGKNLVGAFHHPRAVLLHTGALAQLPLVERRNGLAEAVKHAVVRDATLFDRLERWIGEDDGSLVPPDELVVDCASVKADVVARDDRDQGIRHVLNFGHTVGHAIEAATEHEVPHGHAVAIGMVVEARLAASQFTLPHADVTRIMALLIRMGLPTRPPCSFDEAEPYFAHDKKTADGAIRCALPMQIGETEALEGSWVRTVDPDALRRAWGVPR